MRVETLLLPSGLASSAVTSASIFHNFLENIDHSFNPFALPPTLFQVSVGFDMPNREMETRILDTPVLELKRRELP